MEIIEYNDTGKLLEDLKYWSNALGELHHHGEYGIKEHELPEELQRAYRTLWTAGIGSLCYLVEYKGKYGIALINEFDDMTAEYNSATMDDLFLKMKAKADSFKGMEELQNMTILLGEHSGFFGCHEFITIFPADMEKEAFDKVADLLEQNVYECSDSYMEPYPTWRQLIVQ